MSAPAILIPAAGLGRRMRGGDKLLEEVGGQPLLARQAAMARAVSDQVAVALPDGDGARARALGDLDVLRVAVPDADQGMARSLTRALAALPADIPGVMILPADMPELTGADLARMVEVFAAAGGEMVVQATAADGTPGHPVIFPADCRAALAALEGDRGARPVLEGNRHRLVRLALPGRHALVDLDTPEDWSAWRAARDSQSD